jgi:hypothetical protein
MKIDEIQKEKTIIKKLFPSWYQDRQSVNIRPQWPIGKYEVSPPDPGFFSQ